MMKIGYLIFCSIILSISCYCQSGINRATERIQRVKEATIQILIDNAPSGTGFFINNKGLIVSNMHVIETEHLRVDSSSGKILSIIEAKLNNGNKKEVIVSDFFIKGQGYQIGKFYDFICLELKDKSFISPFLRIGNYTSLNEGDYIYTCGYPFGIEQPVVTSGMVSTKFIQYSADSINHRNVAWLDLSMNKGNSGGAIILVKNDPINDEVIGIASFNLNVLSQYAQQLKIIAQNRNANAILGGLDIKGFAELTAVSIGANSYGIGGLISIEYLKELLK